MHHEYCLTHCLSSPTDSTLTLKNLSKLRELVFPSPFLRPEEDSLTSTITSTNIQKIVPKPFSQQDLGERFQSSLYTELNGLVDRLRASGYKRTLKLEFRHTPSFAETVSGAGPDGFLPKFREKGRGGRLLYCSNWSLGNDLNSEDLKGRKRLGLP